MNMFNVRSFMSDFVLRVAEDDGIDRILDLMEEHDAVSLPVVSESGRFLGVVSERDLFSYAMLFAAGSAWRHDKLGEPRAALTARDVMVRDCLTADPEESVAWAAGRLLETDLWCLPVVEDMKLVGILTHTDFTRYVAEIKETARLAA